MTVPLLDFSTLSEIPKAFRESRIQGARDRTLAELANTTDPEAFDRAGRNLIAAGDLQGGVTLAQIGQKFADRQMQRDLYKRAGEMFGAEPIAAPGAPPASAPTPGPALDRSQPRSVRTNNPGAIEDGDFARAQPGYVRSDGRFAIFETPEAGTAAMDKLLSVYGSKHGINTVAGVVNRWAPPNVDNNSTPAYTARVASALGVDPNATINLGDPAVRAKLAPAMANYEAGRPDARPIDAITTSAAPVSAPTRAAPAPSPTGGAPIPDPTVAGMPIGQAVKKWAAIALHPAASKEMQTFATEMIKGAIQSGQLTNEMKEYNAYVRQEQSAGRAPAPFLDYIVKIKQAGATAITTDLRGENEFEKEFGKDQAKRWAGYIQRGDEAQRGLVDINQMREISRRMGTTGATAGIKEAIGPYAEALGVNVTGLNDIQAYSSIVQRLAPQQRAPGSGATSDIEFKGFLKSLPGLSQNPAAREATLDTMEALARHNVAEAEIAQRLATKEITRKQAEIELRALPDPMAGFRKWRSENAALFSALLKGSPQPAATPAAQPGVPAAGTPAAPATAAPRRSTASVVPEALRAKPLQEQLAAAPVGSVVNIDNQRLIKQQDGTWAPHGQ